MLRIQPLLFPVLWLPRGTGDRGTSPSLGKRKHRSITPPEQPGVPSSRNQHPRPTNSRGGLVFPYRRSQMRKQREKKVYFSTKKENSAYSRDRGKTQRLCSCALSCGVKSRGEFTLRRGGEGRGGEVRFLSSYSQSTWCCRSHDIPSAWSRNALGRDTLWETPPCFRDLLIYGVLNAARDHRPRPSFPGAPPRSCCPRPGRGAVGSPRPGSGSGAGERRARLRGKAGLLLEGSPCELPCSWVQGKLRAKTTPSVGPAALRGRLPGAGPSQ